MKIGIIIAAVAIFWTSLPAATQSLGSNYYPSQDEVFEAYIRGEIDYQTYLNLSEILEFGIDSASQYILEELPDAGFFSGEDSSQYTPSQQEQSEILVSVDQKKDQQVNGRFRIRHYQELSGYQEGENRYYIRTALIPGWNTLVRADEHYTGNPLVSQRSLIYRDYGGIIKEVAIGNYTARFGLGLTIGYRGNLISKDADDIGNSFLFPRYGGFNGLYIEGASGTQEIRWLLHYDQGSQHKLRASAVSLVKKWGPIVVEGIALGGILNNRNTDAHYNHHQFGWYIQYKRRPIEIAGEAAYQKGADAMIPAIVVESKLSISPTSLRIAAWKYDHDFINLMGGPRSGWFYESVRLDEVDLSFNDRRNNQAGFLVRSRTGFGSGFLSSISFLHYGSGRYESRNQLIANIEKSITSSISVRVYYMYDDYDTFPAISKSDEVRGEFQYRASTLLIRTYIGYSINKLQRESLSYFLRLRKPIKAIGELEFWLNFDKFNIESNQSDYLYGYLKETVAVANNFEMSAKYVYRYSRSSTERHRHTAFLEGRVTW